MIDRKIFFDEVRRSIFGRLNQGQVEGLGFLLQEAEERGFSDLRQVAYVLATAYHETAHTMQPIRERGGSNYLRGKRYWPWIGRGYVQLTWKANYVKFQPEVKDLFSADIVKNPDEAMLPRVSAYIIFEGMRRGDFTGVGLSKYINKDKCDFVNARRIVNGTDRAALIAGYAEKFLSALNKAEEKS